MLLIALALAGELSLRFALVGSQFCEPQGGRSSSTSWLRRPQPSVEATDFLATRNYRFNARNRLSNNS
jgi:hypothetical protein